MSLLVFLVISTTSLNVYAEISYIITSLPGELVDTNFDASTSKATRIKIAKKILVSVTTLQSYLPKLTDATIKILVEQERDLNNDMKNITNIDQDTYIKRSKEFYDNPNYYNYKLRQTIALLIDNLNCVITSKTISNEMYC